MPLTEIIQDFEKLLKDIPRIINASIGEKEQQVLDINRSQMYDDGVDSHGKAIAPPYANQTIALKLQRNKSGGRKHEPTTHVALFQDGDFHAKMFIQYREKEVIIWSEDPKIGELTQKYGHRIFGIADYNWEKFLNLVAPVIERRLSMRLSAYK